MNKTLLLTLFFLPVVLSHAEENSYKIIPKVIVTASQPNGYIGQHSILDKQYILDTGAVNTPQVLQGQGGIRIEDLTGDHSEAAVSMRGFGSNAATNSLILFNGIPLDNPDLGTPDLNLLYINDVAGFKVTNGSEGVLYGDQAVGGVVQVISKKPTKRSADINAYYGSYQHKIIYLNLQNSQTNGWSYSLSGMGESTQNYRDHNHLQHHNLFGQLNYDYTTGHTSFYYYFNQIKQQYPGALTAQQVLQNPRQAQNNFNFSNTDHNFFQLHQEQQINEHWFLEANSAYRFQNIQGFLFGNFNQNRQLFYLTPKLHARFDHFIWLTGFDTTLANYHINSILNEKNDRQQEYSLYTQIENSLPWQLHFIAGFRSAWLNNALTKPSQNDPKNRVYIFSLELKKMFSNHWEIYLRRVGNYRFPKVDENALIPKNIQNLQTQTGISYETGIQATFDRLLTHFELYRLDLNNEIAFDPTQTPIQPFGANRNLSSTQRLGIYADTEIPLLANLMLKLQYNYVNPKFTDGEFNNQRIPFVSKHSYTIWTEYAITNHWNFFTEIIYYSQRFVSGDYQNVAEKLPGYVITNLSLKYNYKNFYANLRANNIFNKKYMAFASLNSALNQEFFYPAPDRNIIFTVGYSL